MPASGSAAAPCRLAIAGLSHDHVQGFHRSPLQHIELAGIAESDAGLRQRFASQHGLDPAILFADLSTMLDAVKPEAVCAFGSIFDHLAVVEACAPRGIHVMVEKPLAVSPAHAARMAELTRRHGIHLITNYETTWYASNHAAIDRVSAGEVGAPLKVVIHDGHRGPREIGCSEEFLAWLTDPVLNGAGALVDFGCYGANLMTRLMGGARPISVQALAQQFKPAIYPKVDDEATIVLRYERAVAIIQASWNWAVSRKDMEIYGERGYLVAADALTLKSRKGDADAEVTATLPARTTPHDDPFAEFAAIVRGEFVPDRLDLGGLENNLVVVDILDAAKRAAATGAAVSL